MLWPDYIRHRNGIPRASLGELQLLTAIGGADTLARVTESAFGTFDSMTFAASQNPRNRAMLPTWKHTYEGQEES